MKRIPKRDAERVLSYIEKAVSVLQKAEEQDCEYSMCGEQIDAIYQSFKTLEYLLGNCNWD